MFGFSNSLTHEDIRENSAQAVGELFARRYNVRSVRPTYGSRYVVTTRDGHSMTVKVGTRINLFGEERPFIVSVEE